MPEKPKKEILIEKIQIGSILKVNAIDAASGTEVSFQAPVSTPPHALELIAVKKLAYVLGKRKS